LESDRKFREISRLEHWFERWPDMDARGNHPLGPRWHEDTKAPSARHSAGRNSLESFGPKPSEAPPRRQQKEEIVILIPVFNDWASLEELLPRLDQELSRNGVDADVLVVDDGSLLDADRLDDADRFHAIRRIDVLRLRRNLGHQRAIAIGLAY